MIKVKTALEIDNLIEFMHEEYERDIGTILRQLDRGVSIFPVDGLSDSYVQGLMIRLRTNDRIVNNECKVERRKLKILRKRDMKVIYGDVVVVKEDFSYNLRKR